MKSLFISGVFGLFVFSSVFADDLRIDSLKSEYYVSSPLQRISIAIDISRLYAEVNYDSSLAYIDYAIDYSLSQDAPSLLAEAFLEKGRLFLRWEQLNPGLFSFKQALVYFSESRNSSGLIRTYNEIAHYYRLTGQTDSAGYYYLKSLKLFGNTEDDRVRAETLFFFGRNLVRSGEIDSAVNVLLQSLDYCEKTGWREGEGNISNTLGGLYSVNSEYKEAILYYVKALDVRRKLGNFRDVGITLNNLGNQYLQIGSYEEAIHCYQEASDIFKEIEFTRGIAATLTGMAVIYEGQKQYEAALKVYEEVLEISKEDGPNAEYANTLSNIAVTYSKMLNDSLYTLYGTYYLDTLYVREIKPQIEYGRKSISYNNMALSLREEENDYRGIGITLSNLGSVYQSLGRFSKANEYFQRYSSLPVEYQDEDTRVVNSIGRGRFALYNSDFDEAINFFNTAYRIARKINKKIFILEASGNLADLYEKTGDYRNSLKYFQEYHYVYDSLNQESSKEQVNELMVKYETESKERENELLRKDQIIQDSKLKSIRKALFLVVIAVLVFVILIFELIKQNRFRKKTNEELREKNVVITGQQKEITDSIQYAKRIQHAVLPPDELLKTLFPDHFIIFKPRNIVSGDFFWATRKGDKVISLVADCTGHGVPGAFLSMLSIAFLNEIVSKEDDLSSDYILNEVRDKIIDSLHQTDEPGGSRDGMDASLFILDRKTLHLQFSGALNPLLIVREGKIIELKGDQMPIGIHTYSSKPFTRHEHQLKQGDMLYAYTDGYQDQFGGPRDKKFMSRRLKKILLEICEEPIAFQKEFLLRAFEEWKGNTFQVDDILVLGVRVF